ncbi:hypothetical protein BRD15_11920 [Halobacteriales archaeon SW_6_65_15]|nr:MAG: hypothetical protein BRD15_11920 [Halobacteriales archaeon SW_6_65_15]
MTPETQVLCVGETTGSVAEGLAPLEEADNGVDVESVPTGADAIDYLDRTPVSCLVCRASLPDVGVPTLLDEVRDQTPNLPVVVLSDDGDEELATTVLSYDATDFVHWRGESHQPKQVARRVENAAARRRAERAADRTAVSDEGGWMTASDETGRPTASDAPVRQTPDAAQLTESAIDALPDIFFAFDFEGNLLRWNEKATEVTGYSDEELAERNPLDFFPDEEAGRVAGAIERVRAEGRARIEALLRTKDGREISYEFTGALLEDDDGRPLGIAGTGRDVSERKRREAELESSREKYRRLVETAPDAVFIVDAESGTILDTNEAAERLLDKPRAEIVGMHQSALHPPEEAERYRRIFEEHVEEGSVVRDADDYHAVTDDGERVPIEISAGVTEIGDRTLNQAMFRDITDRKQREETLETLREVTRDLMTAETKQEIYDLTVATARDILDLPITGIHLLDEDERVLRPATSTPEAEALFDGIPSFEEGESLSWRVFEEGRARLYDYLSDREQTYNPETPVQTEMILPLGDHGVLTSGSTESEHLTESEFDLAKILAANAHAALDRAEREQTIARQRAKLEAELDEVFERIDDAFFALDDEWRFTYVNGQAQRLLGTAEADLRGRLLWDVFPEASDSESDDVESDDPEVHEELRRAVETQEPVTYERYFEAFGAWFEVHAYPSESGLSVYFRDVSERKHRERKLERQNERLESFASMLAHELRNPLSIAQIYLQSIERGGTEETGNGETSRDDEAFDEVAAALDRIDDTIDVLLVLARGGDSIIDPEPVSLRESATEAWSNLDADAARLDAETRLTLAAEPHHVRNLLENLFRNAIEHGGRDVTIRVGSLGGEVGNERRQQDGEGAPAGFYVEDDGPGIPADERDAVFEAGYTTDADGLGLGLTFISQLADAYGWECRLTESDEGGARFEFAGVEVVS